jgi:hypothetical protein
MDKNEIAEYLAKKVFNGELKKNRYYIMLKNKLIYSVRDYDRLVEFYEVLPEDVFVYINFNDYEDESYNRPFEYSFPLIDAFGFYGIIQSYLSKLGFYNLNNDVSPATGLKYYGEITLFKDRLVIEIVDIYTVVTNTRLVKIVTDVLGKILLKQKELFFGYIDEEEISRDQIDEIAFKLYNQKLFAGYGFNDAYEIIVKYYINHDTSLAKEVLAIINAYNRVFEPYRVVYDTTTRQQVLM